MAQKKKISSKPKSIVNRRASFDYSLDDELVVGIALTGLETRAARDGHIQLKGSFVSIRDNELWLNNASFSLKLNEKGKVGARSIDTSPRKLLVCQQFYILQLYLFRQMEFALTEFHFLNLPWPPSLHLKL